jgi:hypothetical protein
MDVVYAVVSKNATRRERYPAPKIEAAERHTAPKIVATTMDMMSAVIGKNATRREHHPATKYAATMDMVSAFVNRRPTSSIPNIIIPGHDNKGIPARAQVVTPTVTGAMVKTTVTVDEVNQGRTRTPSWRAEIPHPGRTLQSIRGTMAQKAVR